MNESPGATSAGGFTAVRGLSPHSLKLFNLPVGLSREVQANELKLDKAGLITTPAIVVRPAFLLLRHEPLQHIIQKLQSQLSRLQPFAMGIQQSAVPRLSQRRFQSRQR